MRRLIFNADDFGLTRGVNRAILEAHAKGSVTSATLMAGGKEFDQAVELALSAPQLSVGCHVVLIDGAPQLNAALIPSLAQANADGVTNFRRGWGTFTASALRNVLTPSEIEAETMAQIRKLQSAKIGVSHVDTHKHAHMFPQVLQPLLRAAAHCGVRAVRNPFEPAPLGLLIGNPALWERWLAVKTLSAFSKNFRRMVQDAGMITTDGVIGVIATGSLDARLFRSLLEHLPEGTWEFVCHPGDDDAQLRDIPTRLRASRARELEILTSAETMALLPHHGIEPISYRDLSRE